MKDRTIEENLRDASEATHSLRRNLAYLKGLLIGMGIGIAIGFFLGIIVVTPA